MRATSTWIRVSSISEPRTPRSSNSDPRSHRSGSDPTRLRNQPALVSSSGAIWLVVGGLFAAIAIAVLSTLVMRQPAGLAMGAIVVIVVLYIAMALVRFLVREGRLRLGLLASGMLAIAAVALTALIIVSSVEWNAV